MKKKNCLGGFAAVNAGRIENCYSLVKVSGANMESGGFVGRNSGEISNSFCHMEQAKTKGGFAGQNSGTIAQSYFIHRLSEQNKRFKELSDTALGQRRDELKSEEDVSNLGFDLENIWKFQESEKTLRFTENKWICDALSIAGEQGISSEEAVIIQNADELWELAKQINSGDQTLLNAYIKLDADIDLGGKEWIPIGKERPKAFLGVFDGCGHSVSNFVIRDKKIYNKGFFGFLKGSVCNLTVDCRIRSNGLAGGIAAVCEDGTIGCCAAIVDITGKNSDFGGLVGSNSGRIFQSYAAGHLHIIAIPWWLLLLPAAAVLLVLAIPHFPGQIAQTFAPVPYDPDAIIDPDSENTQPRGDGNFVSFQFEQEIDVDLASGLCAFNFKNPGESNHNIVVQLQFTDNQAVTVMGSTGRTVEEQQTLEETEGYDPETYRTVIAESGAIRPGYMLESLKLVQQPNGATVPAGTYNAIVYLIFYDIGTNNRAMLESQLPVVITVH